jgi:CheY-like chemotaxis protein
MSGTREITILLVEDDLSHARLVRRNLQHSKITNDVVHVSDGQQALDYLFGEGAFAGHEHPWPLLILLDLKMPVLDGFKALERIKTDERTRHIPVIVLSTIDDLHEAARCYDLGCNAYLTKPVDSERFSKVVRDVGLFLSIVAIPNGE